MAEFKRIASAYVKVVDSDSLMIIKETIDSGSLSFEQILSNRHFDDVVNAPLNLANKPTGFNEFSALNNNSTVAYLNKITTQIATDEFNLYIQNRDTPEKVSEAIKGKKSFQLFNSFQKYIKQFLGKDFSYHQTASGNIVNSTLHFNKEPFNLHLLSPGQKTLFAYAILFFYLETNSNANVNESIIIIDEPEKHLHPEAQIILVNALKSILSKSGQLWIATHSIHILSHLDCDEIVMVKDDQIVKPSRTTPGNAFNDLMGIDDHINELISFINSVSDWAFGNFMLQCFKQPEVIFGNNPNDPQFRLFKEFISPSVQITLLDYGAGKGRIGYTLNEDTEVAKKISYSAFEPDKANYELLNNVPNLQSIFSSASEIPREKFDCVLLCNV
ncbi:MAG TPA: AAA family ATPase, partial [Segetibacter sp.]